MQGSVAPSRLPLRSSILPALCGYTYLCFHVHRVVMLSLAVIGAQLSHLCISQYVSCSALPSLFQFPLSFQTIAVPTSHLQPFPHIHAFLPGPALNHIYLITSISPHQSHHLHLITTTLPDPPHHLHLMISVSSQTSHHTYLITSTLPLQPHHSKLIEYSSSHQLHHMHLFKSTPCRSSPHHIDLITSTSSHRPHHIHLITPTSSHPLHHMHLITATSVHPFHHIHDFTAIASHPPHQTHHITSTPTHPFHHIHLITPGPTSHPPTESISSELLWNSNLFMIPAHPPLCTSANLHLSISPFSTLLYSTPPVHHSSMDLVAQALSPSIHEPSKLHCSLPSLLPPILCPTSNSICLSLLSLAISCSIRISIAPWLMTHFSVLVKGSPSCE